uniref:Uncharacterized protein n=1 Tax=Oryza meridionalis TaxID=40149 RepID=A0A0E0E1T9_9ORYZ
MHWIIGNGEATSGGALDTEDANERDIRILGRQGCYKVDKDLMICQRSGVTRYLQEISTHDIVQRRYLMEILAPV